MDNKIDDYLNSEDLVGLDRFFVLQGCLDGYIASRPGITSLAPTVFIVGLIAGFLVFS